MILKCHSEEVSIHINVEKVQLIMYRSNDNPSEVITFGPPLCDCGQKMVYQGIDYVTNKESE